MRWFGAFGVVLIAAILGAGLWVLTSRGVVSLDNPGLNTRLGLVALSMILGIGLSWSMLRQRMSGQSSVDAIDNRDVTAAQGVAGAGTSA